jgi:polyferredoxin
MTMTFPITPIACQPSTSPASPLAGPRTAVSGHDVLQRIGDALASNQERLRHIQLLMVAFYAVAAAIVIFTSSPWSAQFEHWMAILMWGLWWPAVLVGNLLFGQAWCGLLCPDGALTELAGRWSRRAKIPHALRWPGWAIIGFATTLLAVHATNATHNAKATFLILGTLSVGALAIGALFGKGRRVWCRYLCPVSILFEMLSRCAPIYFRVDRAAWNAPIWRRASRIECPVLIDIRNMTGAAGCHMCGRCSGHRNAVVLTIRRPWDETLMLTPASPIRREVAVLMFGLFGLVPATLLAFGLWEVFVPQLLLRLAIAVLLGILIVVAARLVNVGAMRVTQTLVPLAGLGTAALLLKTSFVGIANPASLGDLVSTVAYILIAGGIALSGALAERTFTPMRAQVRSRACIALIIWLAVAGAGAGIFAVSIAAVH